MRACVADTIARRARIVERLPLPVITRPNQVLVRVHATSINPIDARLIGGYGQSLIRTINQCSDASATSAPRILGRDFVGTVFPNPNHSQIKPNQAL